MRELQQILGVSENLENNDMFLLSNASCFYNLKAIMKEICKAENSLPLVGYKPRTPWSENHCSTTEPKSLLSDTVVRDCFNNQTKEWLFITHTTLRKSSFIMKRSQFLANKIQSRKSPHLST